MLKDITIGQYFPGNSIIHKLDPRVKIMAVIIYIIAIFMINKIPVYIPVALVIFSILKITKIPVKFVLKGLKPLYFIIILTFIINTFMTTGEVIYEFWIFHITKEGLKTAVFMALRLVFLVLGTSLLTLTTSPISLTDGMESMMTPLSKIGFPSHQLAMMMTIALRFIPTLFEEADKIIKSQTARGADFESGNILKRAKSLVPLLVPLFINAFRRADELATAMEARCYKGGEGRTRLNELKYQKRDYVGIILLLIFLAVIISTRYLI
ncbi:energy-coupling factor transporter transmembrane component T family protein [Miniphocaeibacter massiliensis]|uniref:energy-coupling factor transporter transmembrane component T family protein n=1 Tax=Miniphocaeibacter massiliensis TaxID=2041841 RepID=UPI000C1C7AD0|nr:energy-coupling factor transporter transmembrane component T [Miniphocaeibacter massiliensis]